MKKNKLFYIIIILIFLICLLSICLSLKNIFSKNHKNNNNIQKKDEIEIINEIVDYVRGYDATNHTNYSNQYTFYDLKNRELYFSGYNTKENEFINQSINIFDNDKKVYNGKIYIRNDGAIYISISSDKKCYVKSFDSEEIEFYDISEKDKCHKLYFINDDETASLLVYNSLNGNLYNQEQISNSSLRISVITSLLDEDAVTYRWYRNNTLVENNSSSTILIESDEDAEYYAQVIFSNNEFIQTEPVTIKIKK